jgi:hypothetical protein
LPSLQTRLTAAPLVTATISRAPTPVVRDRAQIVPTEKPKSKVHFTHHSG